MQKEVTPTWDFLKGSIYDVHSGWAHAAVVLVAWCRTRVELRVAFCPHQELEGKDEEGAEAWDMSVSSDHTRAGCILIPRLCPSWWPGVPLGMSLTAAGGQVCPWGHHCSCMPTVQLQVWGEACSEAGVLGVCHSPHRPFPGAVLALHVPAHA